MDLGLEGRRAIICGASQGIGRAAAESLAAAGAALIICARTPETIARAADEIGARHGVSVVPVACDVATEEGRERLLEACPDPDILINNAGGPPPGDFRDWDRAHWLAALDTNMLAPIMIIRAVIDGMITRRFGRIINITAITVKMPIVELGLSNGARSGLTGFASGLSRQVAAHNVTINNVLPGFIWTERLASVIAYRADEAGITLQNMKAAEMDRVPAGRFGDPDEVGRLCAFLCAQTSGYITGQNMLIDGGLFPGNI